MENQLKESSNDNQLIVSKKRKLKSSKSDKISYLKDKLEEQDIFYVKVYGCDNSVQSWIKKYFGPLYNQDDELVDDNNFCFVCFLKNQNSNYLDLNDLFNVKFYYKSSSLSNHSHHLVTDHELLKENYKHNDQLISKIALDHKFSMNINSFKVNQNLNGQVNFKKLNQKEFNYLLGLLVFTANLPFTFVEEPMFKRFMNAVAPEFKIQSRKTLSTNQLQDSYTEIYTKIHDLILNSSFETVAIYIDIWKCVPKNTNFISFMASLFINGKLTTFLLKFSQLDYPHSADHIKELIGNVLNEFNLINKKLFYVTDQGSNLVLALQNQRRISCLSHILHNFIGVDFLKADADLKYFLLTCRKIVHVLKSASGQTLMNQYYSNSKIKNSNDEHDNESDFEESIRLIDDELVIENNCEYFEDKKEDNLFNDNDMVIIPEFDKLDKDEMKYPSSKIKKDCVTRWQGMFCMFNSIVIHQDSIIFVLSQLYQNKLLFKKNEWIKLKEYTTLLKTFKEASEDFQSKTDSSINKVLVNWIHLRTEIFKFKFSSDDVQNERIKNKLIKSFDDRYEIIDEFIIGSLLDPFFKDLCEIDNYLEKKNLTKKDFIVNYAQSVLDLSYDSFKKDKTIDENMKSFKRSKLSAIYSKNLNEDHPSENDEILKYLSINRQSLNEEMPLIDWWNSQQSFPFMKELASRILNIFASQGICESANSKANLFVRANRSSLLGTNLSKCMFIDWNLSISEEN